MNNIENRIVEMKFDNAQFESAVAKTMDTLDKFKEKLNFEGAGKGMDQLGRATGNYQYTLNDIGQSLDLLNGRFSTMGTIGRRVLENLTDSAYNFAKNGIGKMVSSVTQGGLSRAMNLEQAKFQMQGIFKDAQKVYDVIYNDILPELQGTPYSLDQAAVVIGQLGASGIQASEDVRQATRAIAGLSAMSGRGFDEVGRIFSKVAGQGNMMGGELQQLSTYGINAAANIADYFQRVADGSANATDEVKGHVADIMDAYGSLDEGTIREAASKRMIFYEDMASAMDDLYGAHAKKSTEMYTGALEDLKAALARIGAEPAAVGLEFLRNAFNALVPAVDAVNAVLKPFTNATKDVVEGANGEATFGGQMYGKLAKEVQGLGIQFANLFVRMDENGKITRWTAEGVEKYKQKIKDAGDAAEDWQKAYAKYISEGDGIMNPQMWRILTASTQSFVNILKAVRNVVQPVAKGIAAAFPRITLTSIAKMAEAVRDFTSRLILSGDNMERLKWITQGVFTPIGLMFRALVGIVKAFIKALGIVYDTVKPLLTAILSFASSLGQVMAGFGNFVIDLVGTGASLGKFIASLIIGIAQFFRLDKALALIQKGFLKLSDIFDVAGGKIGDLIGNAVPKVKSFISALGELTHAREIAGYIKILFDNIRSSISKALHISEIAAAVRTFINSFKELSATDGLFGKVIENLRNFIKFLTDLIPFEAIVSGISGAFDRLATSIGRFTKKPAGALKQFFLDRAADIKEFIKNLDQGNAFQVLAKSMIKPYATIKTWMTNLKVILIPLIQNLISYIPQLFGFVTFGDMMAAVGNKIKSTVKEFAKFIGILGELTKTQSEKKLASMRKSLQMFFGTNLADKIIAMRDALSSAGDGFAEKLVAFGQSIGETLRNLDEKSIRKFISTLALLAMAWKYVGVLKSTKMALDGYAQVFNGFGKLLANIQSGFGITAINGAIAKSIRLIGLASALVLFASAVYILSKMDWQQILLGSAVILGALFAFWSILKVLEKLDEDKEGAKKIFNLSLSIAAIGAGVLMMATAVKQVASVWDSSDPERMVAAVISILAIMAAFAGVARVLSGLDGSAKALGKASFALIGIAQGMKGMAEAFAAFGQLDTKSFEQGIEAVVLLMGLFSLFALSVRAGAKVFSASAGLMAIAAAMLVMQKAMAKFGDMDPKAIEQGGKVMGTIIVALIGFALVAGAAEKSILAAGVGMIAIGAAIAIIGEAINRIGGLDPGVFERGSAAIVAMLGAFILFAKFAGGKNTAVSAASILMLAAGIHLLVGAMNELSGIKLFDQLLPGMVKLIALSAGFAASIAILKLAIESLDLEDAANIALVGGGLFLLANAIGTLAAVPITALAIAIIGLAAALVVVGLAMGLFSSISPALLAVGAAFALLGVAALFVGAGLLFLTMALTALVPLLLSLSTVDMGVLTQGLQVIKTVADGLADAFISLAKGVVVFGLACLAAGIGLMSIGAGLLLIGLGATLASLGVALFAGALALLAITIQKFFGGGLLEIISGGFESFASGFTGLFGKLWDKIVGTSGTKSKETRKAIDDGLAEGSSSTEIQESIEKGPKDALDDLNTWGPTGFKTAGEDLTEYMNQGFTGGGNPLDMTTFKETFGKDLKDINTTGYTGALGTMQNMAKGTNKGRTFTDASTDRVRNSIQNKLNSINGFAPGRSIPLGVASGENSGLGSVRSATSNVESAARPSSQYSSGYSVGSGVCDGIVAGIKSGIGIVAQIAWEAGDTAAKKAKQGANVNSPSKKTIPVGEAICEGIVVGIQRTYGLVKTAAYNLGDNATRYVTDAMSTIASAFDADMDFTPTITPVVDLTNVRQGVDGINTMFDDTFGLSTPYSSFNAAQLAARSMNQTSDGEFDAITKLAKEIGAMNETMNARQMVNNINIEGSEDPNAFADALTRRFKLNVRTM